MDLIGRKAKAQVASLNRIIDAHLQELAELDIKLNSTEFQRDDLIKTLRDQDQLIWTMSQQPSWERMQPHFNQLQAGTESRMRLESDRIRDVLIPEVRKAYTETTSKEINHGNEQTSIPNRSNRRSISAITDKSSG